MQYLDALIEGHRYHGFSRFEKLRKKPGRMMASIWYQRTRSIAKKTAQTFFAREMKVVLPEPVSMAIWRSGVFEPDVAFFLLNRLRAGSHFVDVGGHFGYFSMLAQQLTGRSGKVMVFEPNKSSRILLKENLYPETSNIPVATILPYAAGNRPGDLFLQDFGLIGSAFVTAKEVRSQEFKSHGLMKVQTETIDRMLVEHNWRYCDLIKIDAENAELDVLEGAQWSIDSMRPDIIVETGDMPEAPGATRRVLDFLTRSKYIPYEFDQFQLREHHVKEKYAYGNLLLIHQDKNILAA